MSGTLERTGVQGGEHGQGGAIRTNTQHRSQLIQNNTAARHSRQEYAESPKPSPSTRPNSSFPIWASQKVRNSMLSFSLVNFFCVCVFGETFCFCFFLVRFRFVLLCMCFFFLSVVVLFYFIFFCFVVAFLRCFVCVLSFSSIAFSVAVPSTWHFLRNLASSCFV